MTTKERYDRIILRIEELVKHPYLQASDIKEKIANEEGIISRDLATILGFLTDRKLSEYIQSRKYQVAYRYLISAKNRNISHKDAINKTGEIAGVKEQSSLNKIFRRCFGITPMDAYNSQDDTHLTMPKTWDIIAGETSTIRTAPNSQPVTETIYGIDWDIYERISKINDLAVSCGLPLEFSTVAVKLSDELGIKMEKAFSYVEEFLAVRDSILDDAESTEAEIAEVTADDWLWNNASNPDMIYCCIHCSISVPSTLWLIRELSSLGHGPIASLSPYFIRAYSEDDQIHSVYLRKACEYYETHIDDTYTDDDFEDYIDQIRMGKPIEIAFEAMQYEKAMNDFSDADFTFDDVMVDEVEMDFEKWAEQETDYSGSRFGDHFDPDNPNDYE